MVVVDSAVDYGALSGHADSSLLGGIGADGVVRPARVGLPVYPEVMGWSAEDGAEGAVIGSGHGTLKGGLGAQGVPRFLQGKNVSAIVVVQLMDDTHVGVEASNVKVNDSRRSGAIAIGARGKGAHVVSGRDGRRPEGRLVPLGDAERRRDEPWQPVDEPANEELIPEERVGGPPAWWPPWLARAATVRWGGVLRVGVR